MTLETNRILCGNCAEVLATFPDACIDLTVTSPPYDNLRTYNGYVFDFESIARQLYRVTKPGGVVVWVVGDQTVNGSETGTSFRQALYFMGLGFNLHDTMVYKRKTKPLTHPRYEQEFEYMFVLVSGRIKTFNPIMVLTKNYGQKNGATYHEQNGVMIKKWSGSSRKKESRIKGNVWEYSVGGDDGNNHPAVFPEQLSNDHILSWSNPGDIVLDPMCGSGTTLKMAKQLGRQWIGIDISEEYCQLSRKRVNGANVLLSEIFGGI